MLDGATPNQRLKARRKLEGSANPSAKAVAYDVYETLCGRYWLRIAGLVWGSLHVGFMSRRAHRAMLQQDGVWNPGSPPEDDWGAESVANGGWSATLRRRRF